MIISAMRGLQCSVLLAFAGLALASSPVQAQSSAGIASMQFGKGQPQSTSQLPPGQLRRRLESLPPQAKANAMRWLQDISFTGTDLDLLRIDDQGGVFFADSHRPRAVSGSTSVAPASESLWAPGDAFRLHSRPGAPNTVYIDFNGHSFTATAWGAGTFVGQAFSKDADRSTFSDTERSAIIDIWHRVAEDLAPFDIDVTTEEPASFNSRTGRILVTDNVQADGTPMPSSTAGGVAYVGVFGRSNYHTYYSPALVYGNNLGGNGQTYIAEASSHEFGHNLGLSHDGTTTGVAYYAGMGSGLVSWAPIMGNSYSNNITQWSKGEYANANQLQDDLVIIGNLLGFRADDHGDTSAAATALVIGASGNVDASNPELDPYNLLTANKGVINSAADVDVFSFVSGSGPLTLTARPAWEAFNNGTTRRGANLDIGLELRNSANAVVASSEPITDTLATLSATVAAGTYHLIVSGVANATTGYSDYATQGQYFINGTVTTGSADTTAPNPNPMSWAILPSPTSASTISMTASTAVDAISAVQYRFNCVSGGAGCVASAWQSSPSYVASGLAASTLYSFSVQARDGCGNQTLASTSASATTDTPPPPPAYVDAFAGSDIVVAGGVSGTFGNTVSDNGSVQSITEVDSGGKPASRTSTLEHRWSFNVGSGSSATFTANAWSGGSTDGDTFTFQYSTNGGANWATMFNVSSTSAGNLQSYDLPGAPSGALLVRVVDSNRTAGAREFNTINVDHLFIRVAAGEPPPPPPPPPPAALQLTASGTKVKGFPRISLVWSGASSVDVYRNGGVIASAVSGSSYTDNLSSKASATYTHKVCVAGGTTSCSNSTTTSF